PSTPPPRGTSPTSRPPSPRSSPSAHAERPRGPRRSPGPSSSVARLDASASLGAASVGPSHRAKHGGSAPEVPEESGRSVRSSPAREAARAPDPRPAPLAHHPRGPRGGALTLAGTS